MVLQQGSQCNRTYGKQQWAMDKYKTHDAEVASKVVSYAAKLHTKLNRMQDTVVEYVSRPNYPVLVCELVPTSNLDILLADEACRLTKLLVLLDVFCFVYLKIFLLSPLNDLILVLSSHRALCQPMAMLIEQHKHTYKILVVVIKKTVSLRTHVYIYI